MINTFFLIIFFIYGSVKTFWTTKFRLSRLSILHLFFGFSIKSEFQRDLKNFFYALYTVVEI